MGFEASFDLIKTFVALKLSPLLAWQFVQIANSTVLPISKCPTHVWPFNLSRISPALANEIMALLSRILGI